MNLALDGEVARRLDFLLRVFTPRTVFMDLAPVDCDLAVRAAGYVERVWCVDAPERVRRPPCNLRCASMGGVPLRSIDVASSAAVADPGEVHALLAPGGVWFVHGVFIPAPALRERGFSRVQYYAGGFAVPAALARVSRRVVTAAYRER